MTLGSFDGLSGKSIRVVACSCTQTAPHLMSATSRKSLIEAGQKQRNVDLVETRRRICGRNASARRIHRGGDAYREESEARASTLSRHAVVK